MVNDLNERSEDASWCLKNELADLAILEATVERIKGAQKFIALMESFDSDAFHSISRVVFHCFVV